MTAFQIDTTDAERGILRVANLMDLIVKPVRDVVAGMAEEIRVDAISTISKPSPPRSAWFTPPGRVTGNLIVSLRAKMAKPNKNGIRGYVTSANLRDRYAFMLESGAPAINLKPRPFLVPAARRHTAEFVERVTKAVEIAIRESTS